MDLSNSMSIKGNESANNVVSLFGAKKNSINETETIMGARETISASDAETIFNEAIKRNQENRERLRQERLKANKGVLRSYRIKD